MKAPRTYVIVWAVVIAGILANACGGPLAQPSEPTIVRLTSGTPGAGFHPLGEGLARAFDRRVRAIRLDVQESPGAVRNLQALQLGTADIGFAFADVAYMAYVGKLAETSQPFDRLRGIAVLQLTPLHLVAREDAGVDSIHDLRGRRVGIGPAGSGTALTSAIVLNTFGIDPDEVAAVPVSFSDVARLLETRALDAAFVNAGYPAESIARATAVGARLLPVDGAAINSLRAEYPFFRETFIPAGTYPGQTTAVRTIGVDNLLLCRADLPESLVYDLTRAFFEILPDLSSERISLRMMDLANAPATPVPLHDGAARYYRELELTR
jgi:TRAP transporter TAXI family solute receptor